MPADHKSYRTENDMKKGLKKYHQTFLKMLRTEMHAIVPLLIAAIVLHFVSKTIEADTRVIQLLLLSAAALLCQIVFCNSFIRSSYKTDGGRRTAEDGKFGILSKIFRLMRTESAVLLTAFGTALLTAIVRLLYEQLPTLLSPLVSNGVDHAWIITAAQILFGFLFLLLSAFCFEFNGVGTVLSILLPFIGMDLQQSVVVGAMAGTVEFSCVYLLTLAIKRKQWAKEAEPEEINPKENI